MLTHHFIGQIPPEATMQHGFFNQKTTKRSVTSYQNPLKHTTYFISSFESTTPNRDLNHKSGDDTHPASEGQGQETSLKPKRKYVRRAGGGLKTGGQKTQNENGTSPAPSVSSQDDYSAYCEIPYSGTGHHRRSGTPNTEASGNVSDRLTTEILLEYLRREPFTAKYIDPDARRMSIHGNDCLKRKYRKAPYRLQWFHKPNKYPAPKPKGKAPTFTFVAMRNRRERNRLTAALNAKHLWAKVVGILEEDDSEEDDSEEGDSEEDDSEEDDSEEDDPKEYDPKEDDPKEYDPKEDDPKEYDPKEDDPKEDDPKEDDPKEDDPKEDDPKEYDPEEQSTPVKEKGNPTDSIQQNATPPHVALRNKRYPRRRRIIKWTPRASKIRMIQAFMRLFRTNKCCQRRRRTILWTRFKRRQSQKRTDSKRTPLQGSSRS
ncbi:hypothetical protein BJ508DRAFT_322653 [Ascobolus immersus RN42]|uniref:Uncharacterized protein n=1 Tax=Ascobolus immersus RN42 TaxID=1160509 RepID=A0A3N4IVH8_ASCIM|nr:hypothetical protein BJ508DRAFT_322653 [Ascobolus immersus RN42]